MVRSRSRAIPTVLLPLVAFVVSLLATACGGSGGGGTEGNSPTGPSSTTATFTVYNSATGQVGSFTRPAGSLVLTTADLGAAGVDPLRFVVRSAHVGDRIGRRVAWTRTGRASLTASAGAMYDVFVMNASNGASYACADAGDQGDWDPSFATMGYGEDGRFGTLRTAPVGETFTHSARIWTAEDAFDGPGEFAVRELNTALNPFGIAYAGLSYLGTTRTPATIAIVYMNTAPCGADCSLATWVAMGMPEKGGPGSAYWKSWADAWSPDGLMHELAHSWFRAQDYRTKSECGRVPQYPNQGSLSYLLRDPARRFPGGQSPWFSESGKDIARYWALMLR